MLDVSYMVHLANFCSKWGGGRVVRRCRVPYVTGRPTDIGLQLGKPALLVAGKDRGGMILFLLSLYFHSYYSFFPVPLFHLFYYLFYPFSPFLLDTTQSDLQGVMCR